MKYKKERINEIKHQSAMKNINIDANSKEGKILTEVVEKESTLKNRRV